MRIGIVDADLIGRDRHRFPNLVCEKLSGYWKEKGAEVRLLMEFNQIDFYFSDEYDRIYVSKVFTDTPVPDWLIPTDKVQIGGTGFFFDKAPNLPDEIEHHMPDYHLYDDWIEQQVQAAKDTAQKEQKTFRESQFRCQFKEYTDYSIGFLTRGCFRKCGFCVNKKYDHVFQHSPLEEFYDPSRPKICLLDDNFLGCPNWKTLLESVIATEKQFKFKQGLDERLLTDERCKLLFSANYDGDYTFAFDNIGDYDIIQKKLIMIRKYTNKNRIKFYVLVGFESTDEKDIENAFKRIDLLMQYHCVPYIMRFQNKNETPWKESRFRGMYTQIARWCNQQHVFKKMSFRQFCSRCQEYIKTDNSCAATKAITEFEAEFPEIAAKYFDLRYATRGSMNKPWDPEQKDD